MTSDNEDDNISHDGDNGGDDVSHGGDEPTNYAKKKRRKRYSIQEKSSILRTVARLMEQHGMTCSEACEDINISPKLHARWKKTIDAQLAAKKGNIKARSIHSGRDSCLSEATQRRIIAIYL